MHVRHARACADACTLCRVPVVIMLECSVITNALLGKIFEHVYLLKSWSRTRLQLTPNTLCGLIWHAANHSQSSS